MTRFSERLLPVAIFTASIGLSAAIAQDGDGPADKPVDVPFIGNTIAGFRQPELGGKDARRLTQVRRLSGKGKTVGPLDIAGGWLFSVGEKESNGSGMTFRDIRMDRACMLYKAQGPRASLTDSSFQRISATHVCKDGLIRVRGPSSNMVFEDIAIQVSGINKSPGDVPAGIAISGKQPSDVGSNFLFRRVYVSGIMSRHGSFMNGDGISTEGGYSNVRYEDVTVEHNVDAGIDNKARNTTCANVTSAYNRRNFKWWYGVTCDGPVTSIEPGQTGSGQAAHMQIAPRSDGSSVFRFAKVTFVASRPFPLIANGLPSNAGTVIIDQCVKKVPPNTPIVFDPQKKLTLKLGPGC